MTLREFANSAMPEQSAETKESIYEQLRGLLKNIFNTLGVPLSDFNEEKKMPTRYGYEINSYLADIFLRYVQNNHFPSLKEIRDSFENANDLGLELSKIVKYFLDENFTANVYKHLREKISKRQSEIKEKSHLIQSHQETLTVGYDECIIHLISGSIKLCEIDLFLDKVYYQLCEHKPNVLPNLTNYELMILDFMRLNNVLKQISNNLNQMNILNILCASRK